MPLLVTATGLAAAFPRLGVPGLSFAIMAAGALGCLAGGALSRRLGSSAVALGALAVSGGCALVFAFGWQGLSSGWLLALLLVWGASVIADSPQFSALSAQACPRDMVGGALAIQNAAGFAITMISISLVTALFESMGPGAVWLLVPGPLAGLIGYRLAVRARHDGTDRP